MAEEKLSFVHFFQVVMKRFWLIVVFTLVSGLTSAYISYFVVEPVYQAKVGMLISVQPGKESPTLTAAIDESLKLVTTYQDIVQSPFILRKAQSELQADGYDIRIEEDAIQVSRTEESQVFELLVEDQDKVKASLVANAIAAEFDENIQDLMNTKAKHVQIMNQAAVHPDPVSTQPMLIISITLFISFILSIWIALLEDKKRKKRSDS